MLLGTLRGSAQHQPGTGSSVPASSCVRVMKAAEGGRGSCSILPAVPCQFLNALAILTPSWLWIKLSTTVPKCLDSQRKHPAVTPLLLQSSISPHHVISARYQQAVQEQRELSGFLCFWEEPRWWYTCTRGCSQSVGYCLVAASLWEGVRPQMVWGDLSWLSGKPLDRS